MNITLKRYLLSSLITFISMFALSIVAQLEAGALTVETFSWSAALSIMFVATRAGVKGLFEMLVPPSTT